MHPSGPDGTAHVQHRVQEATTDDDAAVVFAIDLPGGAIRTLLAALRQVDGPVDLVLISMCRTQDARYGRADALIVEAIRQWGNSVYSMFRWVLFVVFESFNV